MKYVTFTGEETQKEFLEKCLEQAVTSSLGKFIEKIEDGAE